MPSTTSFRRGSDLRAYVQDSLAAKDKGRAAVAMAGLRERLSAALSSIGALAMPGARARADMTPADAAPTLAPTPASAEADPRPAGQSGAAWSDAREETIRGLRNWAADLAREYRQDFHPIKAARKPPRPASTEKRTLVHGAAEAAFRAGEAAWRAGRFLEPALRFILAHSAPVLKIAAVALAIVGAAGFLSQWPQTESVPEAVEPTAAAPAAPRPRPAWLEISKPYRFYDLAAPLFAREKLAYVARRHATGGGREDVLTFGEFAGKGPFLRLSVYRHGSENTSDAPFFVDMARRGAPLGLALGRATFAQNQATRFGDFETAALSMAQGRLTRDNCRGFRLSADEPGLTIAGFACLAGDDSMSAADLACLVNRLDLMAAGEDRPLRDFFAAAQARGGRGCPDAAQAKKR